MLSIDVDIDGPVELLDAMVGRLDNSRGLMTLLAHELEDYEKDVFRTRAGGRWAADDPDTVDLKGSGQVLVDSGALLRQLTSATISGDSVVVDQGSVFYARFLRDGNRGMPKRDPAPAPTDAHVRRWAEQLVGYVVTGRRS